MEYIAFLVLFSFIIAAVLALVGNENLRKFIVYAAGVIIIAVAGVFAAQWFTAGRTVAYIIDPELVNFVMLIGELFLMCVIVFLSFRYKKYYAALLSVAQTALMVWFEYFAPRSITITQPQFYVDTLAIIMVLIIAVVGSLICIYAVGYMRDYHNHHTEYKERKKFFFSLLFVFLGAMFGLVLSSYLSWIYFFWEITSVVSFLLIGYTRTEESINNAFRAVWMNLLGGFGFAIAIVYAGLNLDIETLQGLLSCGSGYVLVPVIFLAFAGLTKSAQLPFSKWLLGAMVAPTPTSALLHSATMVKAGVYLLLRLAPLMAGNVAGTMVALIGGLTFFMTSIFAIVHSDAKKVLAYSTISNLGLITACAGIGTPETVWAGIFLMIFHAVSKSLLFQSVGAVENATGSRDIEDMHGLIKRQPLLALMIIIGIAGMFLAPFGMLIAKWAALRSFIDSGNVLLIMFVAFGSATTVVYWTKWLAKVIALPPNVKEEKNTTWGGEWVSLFVHAILSVLICLGFPYLSAQVIQPFLAQMFCTIPSEVISTNNLLVMVVMIFAVIVIPMIVYALSLNKKFTKTKYYLAGANIDDSMKFVDSMGEAKEAKPANWYMPELFGEDRWWKPTILLAAAIIVICIVIVVGGVC